jgi:predicted RNase H-like HicB family nuclease
VIPVIGKTSLTLRNTDNSRLSNPKNYSVVYEKSPTGWGAYVPNLPALGVVGKTLAEAKRLIREGIDFHLEGMQKRAKGQRPIAKGQEPKN